MPPLPGDEALRALRDALAVSPDNVPLRRYVAETLRSLGRFDEAETEYRQALSRAPDDARLKIDLATCYHDGGKDSHAAVVLDSLVLRGELDGNGQLLRCRVLLRTKDLAGARAAYRAAVEASPALVDRELEAKLGADAGPVRSGGSAFESGASRDEADEDDDERDDPDRLRARRGGEGSSSRDWSTDVERPKLRFSDVGGMEAVKDEISVKIIQPLLKPELYRAYGKSAGGGILMYGPPGCGKTLLARATAGECKSSFLAIGIHDVLDMWIGNSEKNLHAIFEEARRRKPCVLFFDEVDALAARRSDMQGGHARQVINQFLAELDGVAASNEGVLVLGATNAPWHLDPAFRRPGRFDRILFVPPPDEPARAAILRVLLHGKPQDRIDFDELAAKAKDLSGADLKAVVDLAVEDKLRAAMKTGRPEPLGPKDLAVALRKVKPSTREWFSTARNHALYANQGGLYDDVLRYLGL
jgi:transitional endoplasmic reticulum ATPase